MDREGHRKGGDAHARPPHEDRSRREQRSNEVSVRLTRKYAEMIDGVNLEKASVGDTLDLPARDADVLIAEGWAVPADEDRPVRRLPRRSIAADNPSRKKKT